ncbi:RIP metalloprotease RseP [Ligilactobacillus equi]|uniref:RIP metalloprotease RseP n=1 Tax=Ligilactobacillus equi TaxID=137357 RepID=UPI002ECFEA41|nr:RIP metalloprotease RseP [Ligilactobacillus sp.]
MVITIIAFIVVFGILVFVHELGHYVMAKRAGIMVREFAIGMGPKIFSYRKNETTYTIRILPLGGYVRMAGNQDDEEELQKGMPLTLQLNSEGQVTQINTSQKVTLLNGIPLELTDWDLTDGLWLEGYENGQEDELKRYVVDHDALIVEKDGTPLQIAPRDVQFQEATLPRRMLTNFAGPFNNFLLAIVAFAVVAFLQGGVATTTTTLAAVQKDSPAYVAGLKKGDRIVQINQTKIKNWHQLTQKISQSANQELTVTVKRQGHLQKFQVTPKTKEVSGQKSVIIGIQSKQKLNSSVSAMIAYGFTATWATITAVFSALGAMFTQGFSLNDLGGPVAMYSFTSQAAHYGLTSVVSLLALLSVNLGIMNLLPIPALDGGKLVLNIVEAIRRKPLEEKAELTITLVGVAFLLILMVLVTLNDLHRFFF